MQTVPSKTELRNWIEEIDGKVISCEHLLRDPTADGLSPPPETMDSAEHIFQAGFTDGPMTSIRQAAPYCTITATLNEWQDEGNDMQVFTYTLHCKANS